MSYWKMILPEAATNLIDNPSFDSDSKNGWVTGGSNTIATSTAQSIFGSYSLLCTYQDSLSLASYAITVTDTQHSFSVWVYIPASWDGGALRILPSGFASSVVNDATNRDTDATITDAWQRIDVLWTPDSGDLSGSFAVQALSAPTAGRFFYIDAAQAETGTVTTYLDGDQPGCTWSGTAHASTSTRSQFEASGGTLKDLSDDLNFIVSAQDGTGMPPVNNLSSPLALQPGELFEGQTIRGRNMILTGSIVGSSVTDFHSKKQGLIKALNPNVTTIGTRSQARTFRYTGSGIEKEITAVYDGGLEPGLPIGMTEIDYKLRLKADDPLFRQVGQTASLLDSNDSATFSRIAGQIDGAWNNLGNPAGSGIITDLTFWNGDLYIVGSFLNWDGVAAADYIAKYSAGVWSAVGTYTGSIALKVKVGSDDNLYVAAQDNWWKWDGNTWTIPGTPSSAGYVNDFVFASDGKVYLGGFFTNWDGNANSDYVVVYDFAAGTFAPLGVGANLEVYSTIEVNGVIHFGGDFSSFNAVTTSKYATYNLSTGVTAGITTGFNNEVRSLVADANGRIYVGGLFTNATYPYLAYIEGDVITGFGTPDDNVLHLSIGESGRLYVSGGFTTIGDLATPDRVAFWNGSVFAQLDIDFPGTNPTYVTKEINGDIYVGFEDTGTATYAGSTTISYIGTYNAAPKIIIKRTGGTSAKLVNITNQTTEAELLFNYDLLDGETLTIDTRPGQQTIISSIRGNVYSELLPNSDFGNFFLMTGNGATAQDNLITAFITEAGTPTVTASMIWRDTYISED